MQCRTCGRPSEELICDDCMEETETDVPASHFDGYSSHAIENLSSA